MFVLTHKHKEIFFFFQIPSSCAYFFKKDQYIKTLLEEIEKLKAKLDSESENKENLNMEIEKITQELEGERQNRDKISSELENKTKEHLSLQQQFEDFRISSDQAIEKAFKAADEARTAAEIAKQKYLEIRKEYTESRSSLPILSLPDANDFQVQSSANNHRNVSSLRRPGNVAQAVTVSRSSFIPRFGNQDNLANRFRSEAIRFRISNQLDQSQLPGMVPSRTPRRRSQKSQRAEYEDIAELWH